MKKSVKLVVKSILEMHRNMATKLSHFCFSQDTDTTWAKQDVMTQSKTHISLPGSVANLTLSLYLASVQSPLATVSHKKASNLATYAGGIGELQILT